MRQLAYAKMSWRFGVMAGSDLFLLYATKKPAHSSAEGFVANQMQYGFRAFSR